MSHAPVLQHSSLASSLEINRHQIMSHYHFASRCLLVPPESRSYSKVLLMRLLSQSSSWQAFFLQPAVCTSTQPKSPRHDVAPANPDFVMYRQVCILVDRFPCVGCCRKYADVPRELWPTILSRVPSRNFLPEIRKTSSSGKGLQHSNKGKAF